MLHGFETRLPQNLNIPPTLLAFVPSSQGLTPTSMPPHTSRSPIIHLSSTTRALDGNSLPRRRKGRGCLPAGCCRRWRGSAGAEWRHSRAPAGSAPGWGAPPLPPPRWRGRPACPRRPAHRRAEHPPAQQRPSRLAEWYEGINLQGPATAKHCGTLKSMYHSGFVRHELGWHLNLRNAFLAPLT